MAVHVKVRQDYLQQTNEILRKINHVAKEKFVNISSTESAKFRTLQVRNFVDCVN